MGQVDKFMLENEIETELSHGFNKYIESVLAGNSIPASSLVKELTAAIMEKVESRTISIGVPSPVLDEYTEWYRYPKQFQA